MFYSMQSPLALYRAFKAANVPDDIARDAAYAVSADLEVMISLVGASWEMTPKIPNNVFVSIDMSGQVNRIGRVHNAGSLKNDAQKKPRRCSIKKWDCLNSAAVVGLMRATPLAR
ncbi:MAG: hypothetical protein ACYCS8_07085 [Acidithiobacillus sp.]